MSERVKWGYPMLREGSGTMKFRNRPEIIRAIQSELTRIYRYDDALDVLQWLQDFIRQGDKRRYGVTP